MHPYKHCGLRCRLLITASLAFLAFSLLPLGLSHRPNQVALHYPHFPPLASIIPHFSPLYLWSIPYFSAKPLHDSAKPRQEKDQLENVLEVISECALDAGYLCQKGGQHVRRRQVSTNLA